MRVLVAPDSFTGTLSAAQAADAIAAGWRAHAPADDVTTCPLSDGGSGLVDVLHRALGGQLLSVTVPGPLGDPVPAALLRVGDTAFVESAQACGRHLLAGGAVDPGRVSTTGVGHLLSAAVASGAQRVVVGVGELAGLAAARAALREVELVAATDVDVPLLGFKGAAAVLGERQGATPEQAQALDRSLGHYAQVALAALDAPQRLVAEPGAGAGGGLAFGLLLLGARREIGTETVLSAVGFSRHLAGCDLVVTGEGTLDWRSMRSSVVAGVASAALAAGVPAVVLAGQVESGRRELLSIGVETAYAVAETPAELRGAVADPAGTLAARARRVARTWSRRP